MDGGWWVDDGLMKLILYFGFKRGKTNTNIAKPKLYSMKLDKESKAVYKMCLLTNEVKS